MRVRLQYAVIQVDELKKSQQPLILFNCLANDWYHPTAHRLPTANSDQISGSYPIRLIPQAIPWHNSATVNSSTVWSFSTNFCSTLRLIHGTLEALQCHEQAAHRIRDCYLPHSLFDRLLSLSVILLVDCQ